MRPVAILLLGTLAMASALAPAAEQELFEDIVALGSVFESLPEAALNRCLRGFHRITLQTAPGANPANSYAEAMFEYWPTDTAILWKLSIGNYISNNFTGFTGAHLHHYDPAMGNPIWVHLVPEYGNGDFLPPQNYTNYTWNGIFRTNELSTHGVYSINSFMKDYVANNKIYINVHGINQEPDFTAVI